jgi:ABC-type Mn2+/Zn2+ transport system permease subunit
MIAGVNVITSRTRLSGDTAVGLLFVGMLAGGVMMVSRSDSFAGDVVGILFGEILGVSRRDLIQQAVAVVVIGAVAVVFSRPFMLLAFDPEQVDVAGWSSKHVEILMLSMVAMCVVMSFQTVGTLLVFGMLLAPAGAGALLAHRVPVMVAWAALIGSVSVYLGLLVSYHFDLAAGASIVVCAVVLFFVVLLTRGSARR